MQSGADTWSKIEGQAYCFDKVMSEFAIVSEQTTMVLQSIGGNCHLGAQVSATEPNTNNIFKPYTNVTMV